MPRELITVGEDVLCEHTRPYWRLERAPDGRYPRARSFLFLDETTGEIWAKRQITDGPTIYSVIHTEPPYLLIPQEQELDSLPPGDVLLFICNYLIERNTDDSRTESYSYGGDWNG